MIRIGVLKAIAIVGAMLLPAIAVIAQERDPADKAADPAQPEIVLPKIGDEPKAIDPSELLPKKLTAKATQDFSDSSLREVVAWLRETQGMVVLLDKNALNEIGISPAEPVSDRLRNDPIYLLLNRLESMGLGWYYDDEVLYITSIELAGSRTTTLPYNVGDLLDAGYELEPLLYVVSNTIDPETWEENGGVGALNSLGDVLFVRHADEQQRGVRALLQALRKNSRQTFLNDPPQHLAFRERLQGNVSVNFEDTPLEAAVTELAAAAKSDIRLDRPALRQARIREREPVTLKLEERKLATVLQALVLDMNLTWILRDGVLWITTPKVSESFMRTAVYDVRDLCRNEDESTALIEAIVSQAEPDSWSEVGGPGAIESAKPGTLVVTHQEHVHQQVLHLLETYRMALRSSKPRNRGKEDEEVITVYYRLHSKVAKDLSDLLPSLVRPDTWQGDDANDEDKEKKPGHVFVVASEPDFSKVAAAAKSPETVSQVVDRSVMIIRQTRGAHDEIAEVIRRVQSGDRTGGGLGGGGFGGGFFSIPPETLFNAKPRR